MIPRSCETIPLDYAIKFQEQVLQFNKKYRIELVGTSVYGIRKYTRGAYLLSHMDHLKTHVVSAILNVAQVIIRDCILAAPSSSNILTISRMMSRPPF
jgi:hypothetical protein